MIRLPDCERLLAVARFEHAKFFRRQHLTDRCAYQMVIFNQAQLGVPRKIRCSREVLRTKKGAGISTGAKGEVAD